MKKALGFVGVLILIGVVLFVIPSNFEVTRSITIDASVNKIKDQTLNFKNFNSWSPWSKLDKDMKFEYSGNDGEVGAKYTWDGNDEVGAGSQEIVSITDERTDIKLNFTRPFESQSDVYYTYKEGDNGVEITWGCTGEMPMLFSLMADMDADIGDKYVEGLKALKEICEK